METNWNQYYFKFIERKSNQILNWFNISKHPNITWDIVEANPDKPWCWSGLSENPNITMKNVQENPDKPWNWYGLSKNPNITLDFVNANPDKPWNWYGLSENPNITMKNVQENPDKPWNWTWLSLNTFKKEKEQFELRVRHQKFVQEHLFEEFVKAYMHPNRIQKLLDMGYNIDELDDIL